MEALDLFARTSPAAHPRHLRGNTIVADMGSAFQERSVDADGFRIRYMEAGEGPPLVHLHGAGGLRLTSAHDLLSQRSG